MKLKKVLRKRFDNSCLQLHSNSHKTYWRKIMTEKTTVQVDKQAFDDLSQAIKSIGQTSFNVYDIFTRQLQGIEPTRAEQDIIAGVQVMYKSQCEARKQLPKSLRGDK